MVIGKLAALAPWGRAFAPQAQGLVFESQPRQTFSGIGDVSKWMKILELDENYSKQTKQTNSFRKERDIVCAHARARARERERESESRNISER